MLREGDVYLLDTNVYFEKPTIMLKNVGYKSFVFLFQSKPDDYQKYRYPKHSPCVWMPAFLICKFYLDKDE